MKTLKDTLDLHALVAPKIEGVLFDIDDTLVDLRQAAIDGFIATLGQAGAHLEPQQLRVIAEDFADDAAGAYERYMAGELTFLGQRQVRVDRAYRQAGLPAPSGTDIERWASDYENRVQSQWRPFTDVHAHLDVLSSLGLSFGAVSNNVESYQRNKLLRSGLTDFAVVVGSDTAGAPKPDPAPFLEGCRQLGSTPQTTLYVGDNPINDVVGAQTAGLRAVLLDREGSHIGHRGVIIRGLEELSNALCAR
ncbi:HAD family hydrolase [Glutamicibacter endophyticus]|uniref:HAD family hydrolase n=1 Tax=Glutamicibacter endophyticus TaxID=1522174 RepID=UPI003AF04CFD